MSKFDLSNKTVVLTGVTGGIGSALARRLITRYNCTVYGIARNRERGEALASELGASLRPVYFDVTDENAWRAFDLELNDTRIDVLVNNAGVMHPFVNAPALKAAGVRRVMEINFFSAVTAIDTLLPRIASSHGMIANVVSASAMCALVGTAGYSASKSAYRAYAECLRHELKNIVPVANVYPGFVRTDLFRNSGAEIEDKFLRLFSSPAEKTAKKIIRAIHAKKCRALIGTDARALNILSKLMPVKSGALIANLFRTFGGSMFEGVFTTRDALCGEPFAAACPSCAERDQYDSVCVVTDEEQSENGALPTAERDAQ